MNNETKHYRKAQFERLEGAASIYPAYIKLANNQKGQKMKYRVLVNLNESIVYEVEAESEEQAREIVLSGDIDEGTPARTIDYSRELESCEVI